MNQLHNNLLLPDCLLYDLPPTLPVFPPSRVCVWRLSSRGQIIRAGRGGNGKGRALPGRISISLRAYSELIPDELAILISFENEDFFFTHFNPLINCSWRDENTLLYVTCRVLERERR